MKITINSRQVLNIKKRCNDNNYEVTCLKNAVLYAISSLDLDKTKRDELIFSVNKIKDLPYSLSQSYWEIIVSLLKCHITEARAS